MCIELSFAIFVDALTTMSSRIRKQRKSSSIFKRALLLKVFVRFKEMPICENCFKRSLRSCVVSSLDSVWYMEYVRSNRSRCDVLDSIIAQLEVLFSTHVRLEIELEDIFEK